MLALPTPPARAHLRAFWLAWSAAAFFPFAILGRPLGPTGALATGVAGAAAFALIGWIRPQLAAWPYERWNWLAQHFARAARLWLSGLCFMIIAAVSLAGTRLRWRARAERESGWRRRDASSTRDYESQAGHSSGVHGGEIGTDGIASLFLWGRRSGNYWIWPLIPFFLALQAIAPAAGESMRENIYTLY